MLSIKVLLLQNEFFFFREKDELKVFNSYYFNILLTESSIIIPALD